MSNITELGHYVNDPFRPKDVNGFIAIFNKTKPIYNKYTKQYCNLTVLIEFDCNKNAPWTSDDSTGVAPPPIEYKSISVENCEV